VSSLVVINYSKNTCGLLLLWKVVHERCCEVYDTFHWTRAFVIMLLLIVRCGLFRIKDNVACSYVTEWLTEWVIMLNNTDMSVCVFVWLVLLMTETVRVANVSEDALLLSSVYVVCTVYSDVTRSNDLSPDVLLVRPCHGRWLFSDNSSCKW